MKVAVIQMNSKENKKENVKKAISLVREAASQGANLISLPEYFDYMGPNEEKVALAETIPGPLTDLLCQEAKALGVYIHSGSFFRESNK